ncbi:MAG: Re/Si-specific NAD(P)(+) transhydrogenase subunit alpha [Rhodospirillales bacterium]|nr:Re/Si-specific NAD(P)(+) transhydrogenase subunit alpha [Rhodospirillales bacterium]MCB9973146.1 Re/Si-specific NAD(P)(+) transhydrogenase subunit alpha [Rhodospirillales bacterium]MCB9980138.1 Re/Si-specific NAD(P)(+) transhydrogenase subunit alpha [Rhodospirillales bacterium]
MALTISILKETVPSESRVAATPDTVKKLVALGAKIQIESQAGLGAHIPDQHFQDAGAKICKTVEETLKGADVILKVAPPTEKEITNYPAKALLITQLNPYQNEKLIATLAKAKIDSFAMELVPRISRAQSMDVLSSQSNLAGYKAVLDACEYYGRALPMMMTAAGTIPPAKIFVMGAGVAGLQAIATARRLGAVVSATDVRPAAKEQVQSLGASFVAVEDAEFKAAETAGGYAKEMSKDYQKKQADLIAEHIKKQDIVITTALIPGRAAPKLLTEAHIKSMKPGSVIVDLAAVQGGNTALTETGKVVVKHDVTLIGHENFPSRLAADASALYAKNLLNLLNLIIEKEKGALTINWEDDIIKGIALTRDGTIIHPAFAKEKPAAAPKSQEKPTEEKKTPVAAPPTPKPEKPAPVKKDAVDKKTKPAAAKKKAPAKPKKETAKTTDTKKKQAPKKKDDKA